MTSREIGHEPPSAGRDERPVQGRERSARDRNDSRDEDIFTRGLDLPKGPTRERVHVRGGSYELRGSETRILAVAGTFRVVPVNELRDNAGRPLNARSSDLRHLKQQGLVRLTPHPGRHRTPLVSLTHRGREVLVAHRSREVQSQSFYARGDRRRELAHDANLHRAYERAAERIVASGGRIRGVVLEDEFRRSYQSFLQEPNRGRGDSDGTVSRSAEEIAAWAEEHALSVIDDHLRIPDLRIEYETDEGTPAWEDVEITTEHYRGAHAAATARSGFTCYRASSIRIGGRRSGAGGAPFDPHAAERLLP